MLKALRALDAVLRGETTQASLLRSGQFDVPVAGFAALIVGLGAFYGFCMSWFALFNRDTPAYAQVFGSMVKVPLLFLLTLLVTLPSLYIFNALVGSRLGGLALVRLLVASLAVTLAVLASFGPIVAFFAVTTTSYPFIVLLNVAVFAVAGLLGLAFLLQTLHRLSLDAGEPPAATAKTAGALDRAPGSVLGKNVKKVFFCWVIVYGLVGAQMSWVLRPFIGSPDRPFEWFRYRESNFFEAIARALAQLFS
jgi:hypothetical protein